jgi:hypothetical protein
MLLLIPVALSIRVTPKVLLYFGLGGLPLAVTFFIYNAIAFGSPLQTGYGAYHIYNAFQFHYFTPRFGYYTYWLSKTMSPLLLMGWLGVIVNQRLSWRVRSLVVAWFSAYLIFYCFYFDYEVWWYTRFLLPGFPALIIGSLLTAQALGDQFRKVVDGRGPGMIRWLPVAILLVFVLGSANYHVKLFRILKIGPEQIIHKESCLWADENLPPNSLIVSKEMSGALRFYTRRNILRYDYLAPQHFPVLTRNVTNKGYNFYALLMDGEIAEAKKSLPGKWTHLSTFKEYLSLWKIEPNP